MNSAAYLLPHLSPATTVLDIGSGPGTITGDLARRVRRVTALEATPEALDLTRSGVADAGADNVDFVVSDVHDLELASDSFDVAHAHQVLQHVGDPVQALREMARVTRPGGLVAARDSDYSAFTWYPRVSALDTWLELYVEAARAHGGEPDAGRRLLSWSLAAGLGDLTATSSTWCYADDDARAWWGGLWADRVLQSDFADRARTVGASEEELHRISEGWREWSRCADGWFSLLHGETLSRV